MRRLAVLLFLAVAGALLPAAKADAYKLFKHRWYSSTLTYYDATGGRYKEEIRAAASALNRSGARIRVRSASRRGARVRIGISRNLRGRLGEARYTVRGRTVRSARIYVRPNLGEGWPTPAAARLSATAVFVHELAHVLGLAHENRRCATMNTSQWSRCVLPQVAWQYRCRLLERDDVQGLVRRFGGRARGVGDELCAAEPGPAAPLGVTLTPDPPSGGVTVGWTEGAIPLTRTEVLRKAGGCPTGNGDTTATLIARIESGPGQARSVFDTPTGPGSYCYAVVALGPLGRPGAVSTATINYLGYGPTANFSAEWANAQRTQLRLTDTSTDRDGQVVAWQWSFGDGTTSAQRNPPLKSWARAGTYTVTLTVTDNTGQQSSNSTQVVIQGGSNQIVLSH
jgi:hypothetical protein